VLSTECRSSQRRIARRIQAAAVEQLVEIRHQTKLGLRYALSRRKHFICELDVRPMQVMLPHEGAASKKYEPPLYKFSIVILVVLFLPFIVPPPLWYGARSDDARPTSDVCRIHRA